MSFKREGSGDGGGKGKAVGSSLSSEQLLVERLNRLKGSESGISMDISS